MEQCYGQAWQSWSRWQRGNPKPWEWQQRGQDKSFGPELSRVQAFLGGGDVCCTVCWALRRKMVVLWAGGYAACVLWRHRASGARRNPTKRQSEASLLNNYNQRTCLCLCCRRCPMFLERNCCLSYTSAAAAPPFAWLSTLPNSSSAVQLEC